MGELQIGTNCIGRKFGTIIIDEPIVILDNFKKASIKMSELLSKFNTYKMNTENFKTTTQIKETAYKDGIWQGVEQSEESKAKDYFNANCMKYIGMGSEEFFNQNKKEMDVVKRKKTEIECLYSVSNFATKLLKADDLTTIDARVAKLMTKSANKMAKLARQIDKECEALITERGYEKRKDEQAKVNEAKSKIRELMAFLIKENLPNIELGNITDGEKFIVSFQRERPPDLNQQK